MKVSVFPWSSPSLLRLMRRAAQYNLRNRQAEGEQNRCFWT